MEKSITARLTGRVIMGLVTALNRTNPPRGEVMATETDKSKVIVSLRGAAAGGTSIHHHDFPEIRAEGASPADAAQQLVNHLTRALDSALTNWRRQTVEQAIADVQAFASEKA